MVEHSTADREVPGSNPGVPLTFNLIDSKIFRIKQMYECDPANVESL